MQFVSFLAAAAVVASAQAIAIEQSLAPASAGMSLVRRYNLPKAACNEQSCIIAALADTTGQHPKDIVNPQVTGDNEDGDCCVIAHNPQFADVIYSYRPDLKAYCKAHPYNPATFDRRSMERRTMEARAEAFAIENAKRAVCGPKTLFFARGTFEFGDIGLTVGPNLKNQLGSEWNALGVNYDSSINGDYCLGIPGALIATKTLEAFAASCPNTKIVAGGYSQGAMVVRGAIARSKASTRKLIKGVLTFGDPFEGAKIKGFKGPIATYCADGDGVCTGHLDITGAHLSYSGNSQEIAEAAALANAFVA